MSRDIALAARELAAADDDVLRVIADHDPSMIRDVAAALLWHQAQFAGPVPRMRDQRQQFITRRLTETGRINRRDLCSHFGISHPQASADLTAYRAAFPNAMTYDPTTKAYISKAPRS